MVSLKAADWLRTISRPLGKRLVVRIQWRDVPEFNLAIIPASLIVNPESDSGYDILLPEYIRVVPGSQIIPNIGLTARLRDYELILPGGIVIQNQHGKIKILSTGAIIESDEIWDSVKTVMVLE